MNVNLVSALRKSNYYTWMGCGALFLIFSYNPPREDAEFNLNPILILLVLYFVLSEIATIMMTRFCNQSMNDIRIRNDFRIVIFNSAIKAGIMLAIVSFLIHFCLLLLHNSQTWSWLPDFRSSTAVLIVSPLFPSMACILAAAKTLIKLDVPPL